MSAPLKADDAPARLFEGFDFSNLAVRVHRIKDRGRPTVEERNRLWREVCETLADHARAGRAGAASKRAMAAWLWRYLPALSASEASLTRSLNRKLARFARTGSVMDERPRKNKEKRAPKLAKADREALVWRAVHDHTGDIDAAWFDCHVAEKLSAELRARYPLPKNRRARCPRSVRRQIQAEVKAALPWRIGPRAARLNGACIQRDWRNQFAGDWFSSDDITLPVYYYAEDDLGRVTLTRGQFLPLIDVKSKRILDFVLIDARSYTAAAIRSLISRVCSRFGIPRKGFHFESGIWKTSKLLGGRVPCQPWDDFGETFAERIGVRLVHSLPGNARAKVVENVSGLLQNLMEGEPGYVGRDEKQVKYERVEAAMRDVETGRAHPSEAGFYSAERWMERLHELCGEYNARAQDSAVMGGRMSPDEAWENLQPRDAAGEIIGLTRLPEELRYLLAAHKQIVTVTRNGISLLNGKYRYLSSVTGALVGEHVIAWFDPDRPETLAITDLSGENLQTVPLNPAVDAYQGFDDAPDLARAAAAGVNAHNGYGRRRFSELKAKFMPPATLLIADPASVEKGREMERQRNDLARPANQRLAQDRLPKMSDWETDRQKDWQSRQKESAAIVRKFLQEDDP